MEKIELPIFKKYILNFNLKPEMSVMASCYRHDQILYKEDDPFKITYTFQQNSINGTLIDQEFNVSYGNYMSFGSATTVELDNNIEDLEKLILINAYTDRLVIALFECPEVIELLEIVEITRVLISTDSNNSYKVPQTYLQEIKREKLELSKEDLIAKFSNSEMIRDIYEFILTLRERRIKYDIELQSKAEEARDYNQYMSWKMLEQIRLTGRFQRFIKRELEELESTDIEKTKIVDSVENTGASFSIKKDDNGSN